MQRITSYIVVFLLGFFCLGNNYGQTKESTLFTIEWDNDLFVRTDMYYTNGVQFTLYNGIRGIEAIDNLMALPFGRNNNGHYPNYYALKQEIFTPSIIQDSSMRIGDRPYAGTLLLNYGNQYLSKNKMVWSEISIGLLGQYSFSQETQNYVHDALKAEPGYGWQYQLSDAFLINISAGIRKHLYQSKWQQSGYIAEGSLGLYQTKATVGLYHQLGNYETNFGERVAFDSNDNKLKMSLSVASKLHYVFYDATLQGGISGRDHSIYRIEFKNTNHLVSEFEIGFTYSYKHISSTMKFIFISPEFASGEYHAWGHIGIGFRF
jgi:lipid A 3-O-deacylase